MTRRLSHKERAERAIRMLLKQRWMRAFAENDPSQLVNQAVDAELIARETFPEELVEAAKRMHRTFCDSHEFCMDDPDGILPRSHHPDCTDLRDALSLYEETP